MHPWHDINIGKAAVVSHYNVRLFMVDIFQAAHGDIPIRVEICKGVGPPETLGVSHFAFFVEWIQYDREE